MLKFIMLLVMCVLVLSVVGCQRQSDKVSYNLSQEADNFNVVRQLTVINCISNDILFQMEGKLSIENVGTNLEIVVEDENGNYQKHFVGLSDNVTYVVEQKKYKNINNYKYVLNYNPKMWIPTTVKEIK